MSKTKIWLITAASLILAGCLIFGGLMTFMKWDFNKLSTTKYETNEYEIIDSYNNISIITNTSDVIFVPSDKTSIVCYEEEKLNHSVTVKDGTLIIELVDTKKWYEYIGINFGTSKITVNIPQIQYETLTVKSSTGKVEIPQGFNFKNIDILVSTGHVTCSSSATNLIKIKASTGDVALNNIFAGQIELTTSTGEITASDIKCDGQIKTHVTTGKTVLDNVSCKILTSDGNTGDLMLNNVISSEKFDIKRDTGNVKFENCDAGEIYVETDTGDVTGTLLSDKVFFTQTDTGKIRVPKTTTGGRCEITTDTGNIKISIN